MSVQEAYHLLYSAALIALAFLAGLVLLSAAFRKIVTDRILCINMLGTLVIASIAAINLSAFRERDFVITLTLICVAGAVATYFYLKNLCRRVFPMYEHEAFLSLYGMLTGTASTGVILLREVDPQFETQASDNIVYHQPWAIVFGFPMLLLLPVAAQTLLKGWIVLVILAALFAVMQLIVFRKQIFGKKKQKK